MAWRRLAEEGCGRVWPDLRIFCHCLEIQQAAAWLSCGFRACRPIAGARRNFQVSDVCFSSDARVLSRPVLLVAGILCIAMALRAPVTGVAPLIGMIRAQLGLSSTAAGMLITLPLLAFAGGSLAAAGLARRYGLERTLFGALLLIAAGIVGRSLGSEAALYAGTLVIGAGIALGNVLLPSLVKRDFPQRVAGLTSAYVLTMSVIAGVASAVAIPLAMLSDATWRFSALCLLAVPALGALLWLPQLSRRTRPASVTAHAPHGERLWRSAGLAGHAVPGHQFLRVLCNGELAAGDPAGCRLHGGAGRLAAWPAAADVGGPALFLAPAVRRMKDQRAVAAGAAGASCVAMIGLIVAPGWASLWIVLMGLGMGAGIILGLAFVGLRARHAQQAASLSGMAQFVGYLLAASGPLLIGALHDALGGWSAALALCAAACGDGRPAGLYAGRAIQIGSFPAGAHAAPARAS